MQLLRLETPEAADDFLDGVGFQLLVPLLEQLTELGEVRLLHVPVRVVCTCWNHATLPHVAVSSSCTLQLSYTH